MAVPCNKRIGAEKKKVNIFVRPEGGELKMLKIKIIKIAVVALFIPAAKVTSHIISKKIDGDDYKEPTAEEWRKVRKQGNRSMFLSTLAFYISISTLILKQLLKIIP